MNRLLRSLSSAGIRQRFAVAVIAALAISLAGAASAQNQNGNQLRCESLDGRRQQCDFDGRGRVQLSRQLSRNACVEGQSWGVRDNTIWVDRGCRADFAIVANDRRHHGGWNRRGDNARTESRTITVVCESRDGRRNRCAADTLGQITLGRQLTRENKCVEGRTWGYDSNGIWVDRGCRAEFLIADNGGTYRDRGPSQAMQTLACESDSSRRTYCRADTSFGVQLTRELSLNRCVVNRSWGSDRNGIWVSDGCRAEFALKTRL